MVKFGKMIGATVSKFWDPNVTHLIAGTDDKGACTRTFKFLMAILTGSWIVKVDCMLLPLLFKLCNCFDCIALSEFGLLHTIEIIKVKLIQYDV